MQPIDGCLLFIPDSSLCSVPTEALMNTFFACTSFVMYMMSLLRGPLYSDFNDAKGQ